jgi:hypothetical protein
MFSALRLPLAALGLFLAGCATYKPTGDPRTFATINGVYEKRSLLNWFGAGVAAIDGASTPFRPAFAAEKRQVSPGLHRLQLQYVAGPIIANGETTVRFAPRQHYTVRARSDGRSAVMWVEQGGRRVSSEVSAGKSSTMVVPVMVPVR